MKTHLRAASAIATLLILAACAANSDVKPSVAASAAVVRRADCLTQTGSRITGTGVNCTAFGRSYSGDAIDRTGARTLAEALAQMDSSVAVQH
jgi:Mrp family chromosome partitioning ATPase